MEKYVLHLRYVYTFYSFGELLGCETREETVEIGEGCSFALYQQEDGSFSVSPLMEGYGGKHVILTHPNKDNVVVGVGESAELVYDEYFDSMGDDNHNVYEGIINLELVK